MLSGIKLGAPIRCKALRKGYKKYLYRLFFSIIKYMQWKIKEKQLYFLDIDRLTVHL